MNLDDDRNSKYSGIALQSIKYPKPFTFIIEVNGSIYHGIPYNRINSDLYNEYLGSNNVKELKKKANACDCKREEDKYFCWEYPIETYPGAYEYYLKVSRGGVEKRVFDVSWKFFESIREHIENANMGYKS